MDPVNQTNVLMTQSPCRHENSDETTASGSEFCNNGDVKPALADNIIVFKQEVVNVNSQHKHKSEPDIGNTDVNTVQTSVKQEFVDYEGQSTTIATRPIKRETEHEYHEPDFIDCGQLQLKHETDTTEHSPFTKTSVQDDTRDLSTCILCRKPYNECPHLRLHADVEQYECLLCNKRHKTRKSFEAHQHEKHRNANVERNTETKRYECHICGKRFNRQFGLNRHALLHTGIKSFHCDVCAKSFSLRDTLTKHALTHSGKKPHECQHCGKTFIRKCSLDGHLSIHTGIKRYQCRVCQKTFAQRNTLTRHLAVHDEVKPFQCNVCDKMFTQRFSYTTHILKHSGVSYECRECGKKFTRKDTLTRHLALHGGGKTHVCPVCGKGFSRQQALNRHAKMHDDKETL